MCACVCVWAACAYVFFNRSVTLFNINNERPEFLLRRKQKIGFKWPSSAIYIHTFRFGFGFGFAFMHTHTRFYGVSEEIDFWGILFLIPSDRPHCSFSLSLSLAISLLLPLLASPCHRVIAYFRSFWLHISPFLRCYSSVFSSSFVHFNYLFVYGKPT